MPALATIGYEGARLQDFIACLRGAGVDRLVDVRAVAHSRRPDFRRSALAAALQAAGIAYLHLPQLGNPADGRAAAKAGDLTGYRAIFTAHLAGPPAQAALAEVLRLAGESGICLMCYERDAAHCHRGLIARDLSERHGCTINHLQVQCDLFDVT